MSDLEWLEDWYASHCNGDWEHQFGVQIETFDNPAWGLRLELEGTSHEGISRAWEQLERTEDDWIHWSVNLNRFIAYGGPRNLQELLALARSFLESDPTTLKSDTEYRGSMNQGRPSRAMMHDYRDSGALTYHPETK